MMTQKNKISFPAIKMKQPIGEFLVGAMQADDLVKVSYADVRRLHENEMDDYIGIQRRLTLQRSKELKEYVNSFDATFPTAVILSVKEENAVYDEEKRELTLVGTDDTPIDEVAKIIDGQHRVDGLSAFKGETFEVNVSIFVGVDIATQANIFATVNLAQTKVNRSLAYDLLAYENLRSPQKVAHHIAVALDGLEYSPFFHRIKRLGSATPGRKNETITQAAMVESILDLTSKDPMTDRNSFFHRLRISPPTDNELERFPFRQMFLEKQDDKITQILLNYFTAVKEKWPDSWEDLDRKGNVLPKTNGLKALMRFLKIVYPLTSGGDYSAVPTKSAFSAYFEKVALKDADFNTDTFKPGTSGEATLLKVLRQSLEENSEVQDPLIS
jgi:DGQHR domain-containing protein